MAIAEPQMSPAERYRPAARALHWLIALLVLVVWPFGMVIEFIKDDTKPIFYLVHESLGFLILWVMLARLAVRLIFPPPPHPPMPPLQARVASIVHILLYATLIAQPIIGFLATNALGFPLEWFGLVTVWSPLGKSDAGWTLLGIHSVLGWTILVLFVMHFGGVLHHHVIRRDATLYRMV